MRSSALAVASGLTGLLGAEREIRAQRSGAAHIHARRRRCGALHRHRPARSSPGNADVTRIAAQVVTGIGFIGAGLIFRQGTAHEKPDDGGRCLGRRRDRHGGGMGLFILASGATVIVLLALTIYGVYRAANRAS